MRVSHLSHVDVIFAVLDDRAQNLSQMSRKYRDDAKQLNRRSAMFKIAVSVGIVGFLLLIARFFFW